MPAPKGFKFTKKPCEVCGLVVKHGRKGRPCVHRCPQHNNVCYHPECDMWPYSCKWCMATWAVRNGLSVENQPDWRDLVKAT